MWTKWENIWTKVIKRRVWLPEMVSSQLWWSEHEKHSLTERNVNFTQRHTWCENIHTDAFRWNKKTLSLSPNKRWLTLLRLPAVKRQKTVEPTPVSFPSRSSRLDWEIDYFISFFFFFIILLSFFSSFIILSFYWLFHFYFLFTFLFLSLPCVLRPSAIVVTSLVVGWRP